MNFSHYIARRIALSDGKSFSKIIVRIAIASIAISLSTMIVASAILYGFKNEISAKVFGFWGHIHITDTSINSTLRQKPISKSLPFVKELAEVDQIVYEQPKELFGYRYSTSLEEVESYGGVRHLHNFAMTPALLRTSSEFGPIIIKGVDDSYDWTYAGDVIKEGKGLSTEAIDIPELVVSKHTAAKLELKIGQKLLVSTIKNNKEWKKRYQVVGIYSTGLEEYDDRIAYVSLASAQEILGWEEDEISGIEVVLDDPRDIDLYNEYIYDMIPAGLYSESVRVKYSSIFEWLKLQDINMVVILVLMIIVSVINMITFLLIFILERSHMTGLLMALGADNWQIRKVFVYTGARIVALGLLLGNILGLSACFIQKTFKVVTLDEASYYLSYAPVELSWTTVILLNILCFFVTVLFLIIPSYLVTRISPVKVLKFG